MDVGDQQHDLPDAERVNGVRHYALRHLLPRMGKRL
jgi:hypothetical protein